jgi:hypothetical protein
LLKTPLLIATKTSAQSVPGPMDSFGHNQEKTGGMCGEYGVSPFPSGVDWAATLGHREETDRKCPGKGGRDLE